MENGKKLIQFNTLLDISVQNKTFIPGMGERLVQKNKEEHNKIILSIFAFIIL